MGKQILLVDEKVKARVQKVVDYAKENVVTPIELQQRMAGILPPLGDNPNHAIKLPHGFRVVYSLEQQPIGLIGHLSVSYQLRKTLPNPHHVEEIMKLFQFQHSIENCKVGFEDIGDERQAVTVIELIEDEVV